MSFRGVQVLAWAFIYIFSDLAYRLSQADLYLHHALSGTAGLTRPCYQAVVRMQYDTVRVCRFKRVSNLSSA